MRPALKVAVCLGIFLLAGCQTIGTAVDRVFQPDLHVEMAESDVDLAVAAMQSAMETASDGSSESWSNPETGNSGEVSPIRTYQTDGGYFCREFEERLTISGRTETYDDHACRDDDGVWRFTDS